MITAKKYWTKEISDEILDEQIRQAKAAWIQADKTEPRAKSVEYNRRKKLVIITLKNGAEIHFPPTLIQGLAEASPDNIGNVHLSETGDSVHWEALDVDFSIPGLVSGILGTKAWMSELGRQGGKKSSSAKLSAARENGKKGGRPKKNVVSV